jgi:hypothetical protein
MKENLPLARLLKTLIEGEMDGSPARARKTSHANLNWPQTGYNNVRRGRRARKNRDGGHDVKRSFGDILDQNGGVGPGFDLYGLGWQ